MNYFNESKTYETETKKSYDKTNMQTGMDGAACTSGMMMDMPGMGCCGCNMMPIYECPQEIVCHRYICYDVPQDCQFMLYTKYGMNLHT